MLNLVVRQSPWDDDLAVKVAWEAAMRLMQEYSIMAFVEVVNETIGYKPFHEEPIIEVGRRQIPVDPASLDVKGLVDSVVQAALEEAGAGVEAPKVFNGNDQEAQEAFVSPLLA
ncbi:MAG: hypothetical protein ACP5FT_03670 [Acidilobus sp.]